MAFEFPVELGLIVLFSLIGSFVSMKLRLPSVIGLLMVGMAVGPYNLGYIKNTDLLLATIEIGAVLMLFAVGIEFNIGKLKDFGIKVLAVGFIKMGGVFAISFIGSRLFGLSVLESSFIGAIFMISSTVLFMRVLNQKNLAGKDEIPFLVALLILEDIVAIFTLTFFSGLLNSVDFTFSSILINLSFSFILLIITFALLNYAIKPICSYLIRYRTDETFMFISLGILGLFTYIAMELRLSPTIGAFLAGNILASHPEGKNMEHTMHPFILAFTSLFFFSLGATIRFQSLVLNLPLIIGLFLILFISVMLTMAFSTYVFSGFSKGSAIFSGISMATIGEFGLLLAKISMDADLSIDLVSITTGIIMISAIIMAILLGYEHAIGKFFGRFSWPDNLKIYIKSLEVQAKSVSIKRNSLGRDWKRSVRLFLFLIFAFAAWKLIFAYVPIYFDTISKEVQNIMLLVFFIATSILFVSFYMNVSNFMKVFFTKVIMPLPGTEQEEKVIVIEFIAAVIFFISLIVIPIFAAIYEFNYIQMGVVIIIFLMFVVLLRNMFSRIKDIVDKNYQKFKEITRRP